MSSLRYSGPSSFYRELAELPVPTSAKFINTIATSGVSVVRVSYSIRDHNRNVKRSITKTLTLGSPDLAISSPVMSSTINHDSPEIVAFLVAPSGKRCAVLREVPDANGAKKRYVEVWSGIHIEASQEVTKQHGQFHADDHLGSFSFTPSETALIYTAEANPETTEGQGDDPYPKFRFVPHFGEQMYTTKRPVLFVFRWRSSNLADTTPTPSVTALSLEQPPHTPVIFGQATFVTETRLYVTGYEQTGDGKLLGVKHCFNRPTGIWELVLPSENPDKATTTACKSFKLETGGRSGRSPRVLFDKDRVPTTLFWLSNPLGGPHASTVSLYARDLKGVTKDRLLVDVVYDPSDQEFPGLYTEYSLPDSPFLRFDDKAYIVVQSLWRSRPTLISIDVENGHVIDLTPVLDGQPLYSWNLLGTDGVRSVICARSTPTTPPETVLLTLSQDKFPGTVQVLDRPFISQELKKALDGLDARIIPVPNRHPVETIVVRSKEPVQGHKPFCLTIVHGGPHASSVTSFTPGVLAYALEGYTVSLPNYTGSMGFGEKYIQNLLGKCGALDVADCIATIEVLINLGLSEAGRQVVQGGSHGGFLATHLIGQYPDMFHAAVMRNPVISAGELCASDISDWPFREFGLPFEPGTHVTPESFAKLYAASPIAHVDRVKTPVLLLLGEDDLRVPPTQGRGYYHALKGRGRVVDMLVFPKETHSIDGVEAARVSFEAGRDWLRAFTEGK
ncbi:Alpha/Beta hydrolase protein [Boletus edulis BED1]|uniref:acylaminoacyl-peptidase n=1 Tax=Boletus edulis BED1 TaxID=1328754 RepID=A0AAD4BRN9_BOLED|nr:Alpha/Beta hydrolase protein [Boletus edulis BED1]